MSVENIHYLPKLVDLRFAPKCGLTNSKILWLKLGGRKNYTYIKGGPSNHREKQWWDYGDILDPPFRKNSIRFAIKRDPVKRFLSCVDHLNRQYHVKNASIRPYPAKGFSSLEEAITAIEKGNVMNWHFLTQTYFYGDKNKYNYVYDLTDMDQAISHMLEIINPPWSENKKNQIINLRENKSIKGLSLEVTHDIIERIKILYRIDYESGWC